jgi:hypothetical protein
VADRTRRSVLDGPAARLAALGVFGLCAAALVYIHRDDIWPPPAAEAEAEAGDPAAARCIAERFAQVNAMVDDGIIGPEQVELFKSRAAAFCQAQAEGGGPPGPGLPGAAPAVRLPGN